MLLAGAERPGSAPPALSGETGAGVWSVMRLLQVEGSLWSDDEVPRGVGLHALLRHPLFDLQPHSFSEVQTDLTAALQANYELMVEGG